MKKSEHVWRVCYIRRSIERTNEIEEIGSNHLESANLWISPPQEEFDKIINEGMESLQNFNGFFSRDVHIAIKDGYHPFKVILCRVLLGREGREYDTRYGKIYLKRICFIPSFIVTFTSVIEEVISARSSEVQRDEVYERLINKGEYRVSKENLVVDTEPEKENKVEEVTIQSL